MKRRDFFKAVATTPLVFIRLETQRNRPIGLDDRNERPIHENDWLRCKTHTSDVKEVIGVVKWAKKMAGFVLMDGGIMTLGTFYINFGIGLATIANLPDGRIDGEIIERDKEKVPRIIWNDETF